MNELLRSILGRREDQPTRGGVPPFLDAALKRAQLAIGEDAGVFGLESGEERFTKDVRLGLEPRAHLHGIPCSRQ